MDHKDNIQPEDIILALKSCFEEIKNLKEDNKRNIRNLEEEILNLKEVGTLCVVFEKMECTISFYKAIKRDN